MGWQSLWGGQVEAALFGRTTVGLSNSSTGYGGDNGRVAPSGWDTSFSPLRAAYYVKRKTQIIGWLMVDRSLLMRGRRLRDSPHAYIMPLVR